MDTDRVERACPMCGLLVLVPGRSYGIDPAAVCKGHTWTIAAGPRTFGGQGSAHGPDTHGEHIEVVARAAFDAAGTRSPSDLRKALRWIAENAIEREVRDRAEAALKDA